MFNSGQSDGQQTKSSETKKTPGGDTHSDPGPNLKPDAVKFGQTTLIRGDSLHAKQMVQDARQSGKIIGTDGREYDTSSSKGKGILAEIQALGQGDSPRGASLIGDLTAKRAANIAKVNNVLKAQGKPLIGAQTQAAA